MPRRAGWIEKRLENWSFRLTSEIEKVLLDTTEGLLGTFQRVGVSQREIARRIDKTEAYVSRALRGTQNLTLKTICTLALAAGHRPSIRFEPVQEIEAEWSTPSIRLPTVASPRVPPVAINYSAQKDLSRPIGGDGKALAA